MSKIIDITDKLNFEEKPQFKIKNTVVSANNDAVTLLKIISIFEDGKGAITTGGILKMFELLFDEKNKEKVNKLSLTLNDFSTFIITVAEEIIGKDDEGETQTPATT